MIKSLKIASYLDGLLGGLLLLVLLLLVEQWRSNEPRQFSYGQAKKVRIIPDVKPEQESYYLLQKPDTLLHLSGSTDLLCDPPSLKLWDVNEDGKMDLYFEHCGGQGYVSGAENTLVYTALADHEFAFKKGIYPWLFDPFLVGLTRLFCLLLLFLLIYRYWQK